MGDTRGASEDARPERDAAYHTVVAWPGKDKRKLRWKKVYVDGALKGAPQAAVRARYMAGDLRSDVGYGGGAAWGAQEDESTDPTLCRDEGGADGVPGIEERREIAPRKNLARTCGRMESPKLLVPHCGEDVQSELSDPITQPE
ncbi:hypothetical protein C8J57DRAFT_1235152 [Mycena rebaudengoi]|nr:hypothetical protein C8J57DRAFT_1235152 [Mycena rebaudengoi]